MYSRSEATGLILLGGARDPLGSSSALRLSEVDVSNRFCTTMVGALDRLVVGRLRRTDGGTGFFTETEAMNAGSSISFFLDFFTDVDFASCELRVRPPILF